MNQNSLPPDVARFFTREQLEALPREAKMVLDEIRFAACGFAGQSRHAPSPATMENIWRDREAGIQQIHKAILACRPGAWGGPGCLAHEGLDIDPKTGLCIEGRYLARRRVA